jgi:energy-coupling factor transporter ATP-binding protein EcfA2
MKARIEVVSDIERSARVQQVEGIFDVAPGQRSRKTWDVDLPIEERDWSIGLICGPSGCGKTTVARKLFGDCIVSGYDWPERASILDGFPKGVGIKDITGYLSSVGFSSPPAWLRPYGVLSNGEQFRVTMARVLCEPGDVAVVDEFTSVVDRTVAKIGSAAIGKAVRRGKKKFIAVTCHMDVEEWLQPDWVFLPAEGKFLWRSVQPRPAIDLTINRASAREWRLFKHHHYMTADINAAAWCFVAFWQGQPVGFDAWLPFVGRLRGTQKGRRGHRTVVLPDFQGVGIGRELFDTVACMWHSLGYRAFSGTGHPAEIASRKRSGKWRCTKPPGFSARGKHNVDATRATDRLRASFEYIGPKMPVERANILLHTTC